MPLNESRIQEGWVVFEHCSLFLLQVSESAACSGFWVPLCLSCLSSVWAWVHLASPISPSFCVREPFSSPCYAQKFPLLSLALGDAPPPYPLILVANTPLFPPNGNTWGGVCLPLQCGWGSCTVFGGGRAHRGTPLHPTSCEYIFLSLLLSHQRVGHLCSDLDVWVDGGLQPCPFPWCVVMFFNDYFSLHLLMCLCISAAAYTCP